MLPATRQRWHSRPYPSRSWYSIKRPRGMQGWVDLVGLLHTGMVYPSEDGTQPGTNRARRALTSFIRRTPLTTSPRRQPKSCCTQNTVLLDAWQTLSASRNLRCTWNCFCLLVLKVWRPVARLFVVELLQNCTHAWNERCDVVASRKCLRRLICY